MTELGRRSSNRVNRGGSWNNDARNCRVSNRNNNTPDNRNNNLGLRLALPNSHPSKAAAVNRPNPFREQCPDKLAVTSMTQKGILVT
ncbi:MAG: SUMF1/EgtB/PvdO family nonheme iron enzyme [Muribaculaceae bacterium]|nr:SUMF1/EgtB/PvdO family nonheme iron enzyme [Muribaculaceae bacterium]